MPGPRYGRRTRIALGFAAWTAVLSVLCWGGLTPERERFLRSPAGRATFRLTPSRLLEEVRLDLANDGDILRYFAYANAALGRPYAHEFVRPFSEWMAAFASGTPGGQGPEGDVVPTAPLVPYRDYLVEYPPGFFVVALPPALAARTSAGYVAWFCGWMAALLTAALLLCRRIAARLAAGQGAADALPAAAAAGLALLGVVSTHRLDPAVSFLVCAAVWGAAERRPGLSGAALGLAAAIKLVPVFLAPLFLAYLVAEAAATPGAEARGQVRRAAIRFSLAAAVAALAICGPALWLAGGGALDVLRYHGLRPLQSESLAGGFLGVARAFAPAIATARYTFGSLNLDSPAAPTLARLSTAAGLFALLLALGLSVPRLLRAATPEARLLALVDGVVAALSGFMAFSKVLSPQYLIWLFPLWFVALAGRPRWMTALLYTTFALTQVIYPFSYGALGRLETSAYAFVLARDLLLVALFALLLRPRPPQLAPSSRGPSME